MLFNEENDQAKDLLYNNCFGAGGQIFIVEEGCQFERLGPFLSHLDLMTQWCTHWGVEVCVYCLRPNHVHLIAVPPSEDALSHAIGEAHRRYTRRVNFREGWRGHLWQGRFASFPMDKAYLYLGSALCGTESCDSEVG